MKAARAILACLMIAMLISGCGGGGGGSSDSSVIAPSLTLVKQVINDNGGTAVAGDWTLTATGYNAADPQTGTYNLSESGPDGYSLTSLTCDNSAGQVTSVTLAPGDNVTCTFVNDDVPGSVATLAGLELSPGVLDQLFQSSQFEYSTTVGFLARTLTLTPITADPAAMVNVNDQAVLSGSTSEPIPLIVGANIIWIDVTAEDGVNTARYILTVNRQDENEFAQQACIRASNSGTGDQFGYSLALSGDTLAVGAYSEDSSAPGIGGGQNDNDLAMNSGAVYIFTRSGTEWSQQAYLKASNAGQNDFFGISLALSGDTLAVGANLEDSNATGVADGMDDNELAKDSGAVYIFTRSGTEWSQQAYIKASNTGSNDNFGYSVALSGDTLAVGAYYEDSSATGIGDGLEDNNLAENSGAVYIFTRSDTQWSQQAYIKASNTDAQDQFGISVALFDNTLAVGANKEASGATGIDDNDDQDDNSETNAGAAYVFFRDGTTWSQQAYIKASNTEAGDAFGWSLALSGDILSVGAVFEDSGATGINNNAQQNDNSAVDAGAVYVFVRHNGTWLQEAYIKASNTGSNDRFGFSLALSAETLAVGADREDSSSTGIDGDQDNNLRDSGAVYLFRRDMEAWSQWAYLKPDPTDQDNFFGYSVALDGDTVSSGTPGDDGIDNSLSGSGATFIFR